jgi:DNA protecting protein dprA
MKKSNNALNILVTKEIKGIGKAWIVKNIKGNESVEEIVSLLNHKLKKEEEITVDFFESRKAQISQELDRFEEIYDGLVAIGDRNFPKYRGDVKESERPIYLFYKGDLSLLDEENKCVTVIGLLNPEENIIEREKKIVAELVKKDITIVSGLAFGCDSIAHEQSLKGGKTIAILPSPIHNILPARNKGLAFEIVEKGGLLISEYYTDFKNPKELTTRYVERDRLQALFCDTIILIASYAQDSAINREELLGQKLDSGARIAMQKAKEYGIPRLLMYDKRNDVNNPMFDLNRQLIKEGDVQVLTPKIIEYIVKEISSQKESSSFIQGELNFDRNRG